MIEGLLSHFDDNTNHKYNPKNNNMSFRKVYTDPRSPDKPSDCWAVRSGPYQIFKLERLLCYRRKRTSNPSNKEELERQMKIILNGKNLGVIFLKFLNGNFIFSIFRLPQIFERRFLESFYTIYKLWNYFHRPTVLYWPWCSEFHGGRKDHNGYLKIKPCVSCEWKDNC